ncbi:MAG: TatD family deoxyribonuclease [Bacteroidetes bacterium]|jgi:TatD DNase family protein|nr:TatD family deoxyribonuclease [Bacteroidota bacterium]MDF2450963.1 TatD family deoxyribonuclease [Bacteroidota bacterium]
MFIDTHTHLYSEEFDNDRFDRINDAISKSVDKFYMPNVDSTTIDGMLALEVHFPEVCLPMMGLHPCSVKANYRDELELVKKWLDLRRFAAIGEIGIDLYWDKTFIKEQELAFREQIFWALEYNYTIVIHCRNAFDEIFSILKSYEKLPKGIFHCFSGDYIQAQKILSLGNFKLGIGGVVTFKNSGLDKVVEQLNLHDIVLETDAPYLAPIPYRGKRNESSYIPLIAEKIAQIKNISIEEVAAVTSSNADEIFEN